MALHKTEIIVVKNKNEFPNTMGKEYPCVSHPEARDAIAVFEEFTGRIPAKVWHYVTESNKFNSWFIPLEDIPCESATTE